jgi:hypothetical protein
MPSYAYEKTRNPIFCFAIGDSSINYASERLLFLYLIRSPGYD